MVQAKFAAARGEQKPQDGPEETGTKEEIHQPGTSGPKTAGTPQDVVTQGQSQAQKNGLEKCKPLKGNGQLHQPKSLAQKLRGSPASDS